MLQVALALSVLLCPQEPAPQTKIDKLRQHVERAEVLAKETKLPEARGAAQAAWKIAEGLGEEEKAEAEAQRLLWRLGYAADSAQDLQTAHDAWAQVTAHRQRTLPEDHHDLQVARINLADTKSALGDLHGALALHKLQSGCGENVLWIGLNDVATEGTFGWVSGEPVAFTNWAQGSPNNNWNADHVFQDWNGGWVSAVFNRRSAGSFPCQNVPIRGLVETNVTTWASYGAGLAGSAGQLPQVTGLGGAAPGRTVSVQVSRGLGGAGGLLLVGSSSASAPILGGTILAMPNVTVSFVLDGTFGVAGAGSFALPITIPPNPALTGSCLYFQALVLDPSAAFGVAMSSGLKVTVG